MIQVVLVNSVILQSIMIQVI